MNCCFGWGAIDWTKEEVKKLRNAECSENLKNLIEISFKDKEDGKKFQVQLNLQEKISKMVEITSFSDDAERYVIKLNENNKCPLLTDDDLCSVQRELGEEYLSNTCRVYPRIFLGFGEMVMGFCHTSCYHVVDILCNDSESMILEALSGKKEKMTLKYQTYTQENFAKNPELRYRRQFIELFYDIISDGSRSLETALILGALAASSLTKLIAKGDYARIPEHISEFKKQINNPEMIAKVDNIKSNDELRWSFGSRLNKSIIELNISNLIKEYNGNISMEKFLEGEKKFREAFSDRPFAMRNIALNLLLDLNVPFRDIKATLFENYCYFVSAVALIKFIGSVSYISSDEPEKFFKTAAAYANRYFSHSVAMIKSIMDILKEFHCTSPAYLAAIIK